MAEHDVDALVTNTREYFLRADAGRADVLDLFTEQVEIYFPKFGVRRGRAAFAQLAEGLLKPIERLSHDLDRTSFKAVGSTVFVEGLTRGAMRAGDEWEGGSTPGGRFCSVFDFQGDKIARMYIYLDPDYIAADTDRFLWPSEGRLHW